MFTEITKQACLNYKAKCAQIMILNMLLKSWEISENVYYYL